MGQRFLRWRVVDACETISYVGELCIISNILSVLAPHLFYFILFLDPLCMYTSFCLPLFSNPFVSLFSIFPQDSSFFRSSFTALFTLFRALVYLPHSPVSSPHLFHRPLSPPTFETLINSNSVSLVDGSRRVVYFS